MNNDQSVRSNRISLAQPSRYRWKTRYCPGLGYAVNAWDFSGKMAEGYYVSDDGHNEYLKGNPLKIPESQKMIRDRAKKGGRQYLTVADFVDALEANGKPMPLSELNKELGLAPHSKSMALRHALSQGRIKVVGHYRTGTGNPAYYGTPGMTMEQPDTEERLQQALSVIERNRQASAKEIATALGWGESNTIAAIKQLEQQDRIYAFNCGGTYYYEVA